MKTKYYSILVALLALTLVMSACGIKVNPYNPVHENLQAQGVGPVLLAAPAIALDEAKEVAKTLVQAQEVLFLEAEYDPEDGHYELEFVAQGVKYDVELDGVTGQVLETKQEPVPPAPPATQPAPQMLTLEEAKAIVFAHLGITEDQTWDRDFELDGNRYDIDFKVGSMEYDFEVDAYTGKILQAHQEPEEDLPPATQPASQMLTLEEAKAIVFAHLGITEDQTYDWDYDLEDGVYELEFKVGRMEYDMEVSASTGKILKAEQELDD